MLKQSLASGLAAAVALGGALVAAPAGAAVAPPDDADRGPVTDGAAWLATQVPETGIFSISYEYEGQTGTFDDTGLTIDGARALEFVGGQTGVVSAMTDGIVSNLPGYYDSFGTTYADNTAKAASFLLERDAEAGATQAAVATLQDTVSTTAPIAGRLEDQTSGSTDYASPIGQAYAVQALAEADAPELAAARSFLLAQQCDDGYFRASFTSDKTAADQSCDGAPAAQQGASVDTTAFTVLALQDLATTDTEVAAALDDATGWLASTQGEDGSFGGNANSTGLAGWAMGVEGFTGNASDAALWLRQHQLANAGACTPYAAADDGALVVDDLGLLNAQAAPFDDIDRSVALRATAQALPALAWAPGGNDGDGLTAVQLPGGFVRAGTTQRVRVAGAPGNVLCVKPGSAARRLVTLPASGRATVPVKLPARTATTTISITDAAGRTPGGSITGLGAAKLRVTVVKRGPRGRSGLVTARGLRAGEKVTLLVRGRVVRTGKAVAGGVFKRLVPLGAPGAAKVVVRGQFANRVGSRTVTVPR